MESWRKELYICHHGILGMKWGKENGPPYPLGSGEHSASEKKAGWRKSLGGGRNEDEYDRKKKKSDKSKQNVSHEKRLEEHKKRLDEMSPEERERVKKVAKRILIAAAVVGVAAAGTYVYKKHGAEIADALAKKHGAKNLVDLNKMDPDLAKSVAKDAMTQAAKDVVSAYPPDAVVLQQGHVLKRMDANKDFDLGKAGDYLYAAANDQDADIYKAFLPTRNADGSVSQDRYQVTLKAAKDIIAPGRDETNNIIAEMMKNDPSFKDDIIDDTVNMLKKNNPLFAIANTPDQQRNYVAQQLFAQHDDAYNAITALGAGKEGKSYKKIVDALSKKGYNATLDYHDIDDKLSNMPMIIFSPENNLVKTGQKVVSQNDTFKAANNLAKLIKSGKFEGSDEYTNVIKNALLQFGILIR